MKYIKKVLYYLINIIFPQSPNIQSLENLETSELENILHKNNINLPNHFMAIFSYKDPNVRAIILEIKYRGNKNLANKCGEIIYNNLLAELSDKKIFENFSNPILIPVPISTKRRIERGFNQVEFLADGLIKLDKTKNLEYLPKILIKHKHTDSQTKTKNKKMRMENLKDCFSVVEPEKINGRNIVILDDVITTGSTLEEIRKQLKNAGANKIICLALAH